MSGRHYAAEGRKSVEDTHLATARRQWEGNGISGLNEKIQSRNKALFFVKLPGTGTCMEENVVFYGQRFTEKTKNIREV